MNTPALDNCCEGHKHTIVPAGEPVAAPFLGKTNKEGEAIVNIVGDSPVAICTCHGGWTCAVIELPQSVMANLDVQP